MGKIKGPYKEEYSVGTKVRIVNRDRLKKFIIEWKLHNPLNQEQLKYANKVAEVEAVSFYHGGDELYKLCGIPGLWHEVNLLAIDKT